MTEVSKFFFTQGILGILCLVLGWVVFYLWRDNRALYQRLEAKSDKNTEKNQELAAQAMELAKAYSAKERRRSTTRANPTP